MIKMPPLRWSICSLAFLLAGCQSMTHKATQESVNEIEQAMQANAGLPQAPKLEAPELLPPLTLEQLAAPAEQRFDLTVEQMPARDFFMGLVTDTPYNMLVHQGISGEITLSLKNVTVDEVMQAVQQVYGYEYRHQGNLYQVVPAKLETRIYQVNYLDVQRSGRSDVQVSTGSVRDAGSSSSDNNDSGSSSDSASSQSSSGVIGTQISTESRTDFWGGLQQNLNLLLGGEPGRRVLVSSQTGTVVVHALPSEQATVQEYLEKSELMLKRQVVIEAKILEVELSDGFRSGIQWQALGGIGSHKSGVYRQGGDPTQPLYNGRVPTELTNIFNNPAINNATGAFSAALELNDFNVLIELLGTQGDVQVLSSPRVSTMNNQKAVIKVGTDEFFVTDVQNTTTTGNSTTTTPDIELTPFFSGIALDVTPQISEDDEIILHIHPSVSEVQDQQKLISIGTDSFDVPLAFSSIRESDSVVSARSGQVIVIGGLMKTGASNSVAKTPLLGDIPGLGNLFKQQNRQSSKSELVILLKPVVASGQAWQQELERSLKTFEGLKRPAGKR